MLSSLIITLILFGANEEESVVILLIFFSAYSVSHIHKLKMNAHSTQQQINCMQDTSLKFYRLQSRQRLALLRLDTLAMVQSKRIQSALSLCMHPTSTPTVIDKPSINTSSSVVTLVERSFEALESTSQIYETAAYKIQSCIDRIPISKAYMRSYRKIKTPRKRVVRAVMKKELTDSSSIASSTDFEADQIIKASVHSEDEFDSHLQAFFE
jgi:hypothetical protein